MEEKAHKQREYERERKKMYEFLVLCSNANYYHLVEIKQFEFPIQQFFYAIPCLFFAYSSLLTSSVQALKMNTFNDQFASYCKT